MKELDKKRYESLHKRFIKRNFPLSHTLEEICTVLKQKYNACEFDKVKVSDLRNDPMVHYKSISKCLEITDLNVLRDLRTREEQIELEEMLPILEEDPVERNLYDSEEEYQTALLWDDIQKGERVHIILESKNGEEISNITFQGMYESLEKEFSVLIGVKKKDASIEKEDFRDFLDLLAELQYI